MDYIPYNWAPGWTAVYKCEWLIPVEVGQCLKAKSQTRHKVLLTWHVIAAILPHGATAQLHLSNGSHFSIMAGNSEISKPGNWGAKLVSQSWCPLVITWCPRPSPKTQWGVGVLTHSLFKQLPMTWWPGSSTQKMTKSMTTICFSECLLKHKTL